MSRTIHVIVTSRHGDEEYGLQFTAGDWDETRKPTIKDVDPRYCAEAEKAMREYEREHGYPEGDLLWELDAVDVEALLAEAEA